MKELIRKRLGQKTFQRAKSIYRGIKGLKAVKFWLLVKNFGVDFYSFYQYSNVFKVDTFEKLEAKIILKYHSLEKGLVHDHIRFRFGKQNVIILARLLKKSEVVERRSFSQIKAAYILLCNYYNLHCENNVDISDYFNREDFELFQEYAQSDSQSIVLHKKDVYFTNSKDFFDFSHSRSSVRDFTGEKIPLARIKDVIHLARNAPSVCNRQPVKIYHVGNKEKIDQIFQIQQGLNGYSDNISQVLVVVSDRNYFYTIGERNQLYIDGGIFLMNLLYSLHYYGIGACPAHWGLQTSADKKLQKIIPIKKSEKVISLVAIGVPKEKFSTCLSLRRSSEEILKIV